MGKMEKLFQDAFEPAKRGQVYDGASHGHNCDSFRGLCRFNVIAMGHGTWGLYT